MTSPDSWVRSAYSVFWSRPGSGSHDYEPLGATRRPRSRRLRGWQALAAALVVTVLGLSTLGLVVHQPGVSLRTRKDSGAGLALSSESVRAEAAPEVVQGVVRDREEGEGEKVSAEVGHEVGQAQSGRRPPVSGVSAPQQREKTTEELPLLQQQPQQPPQPQQQQPQQQQQQPPQPEETLVVLRPVDTKDANIGASGNGPPVAGD